MRRLLIALLVAGCASTAGKATLATAAAPSPSPTGPADFSGTWVADAGACVTDGFAISQAGPNLTIRTVRAKAGFSSPIPTKLEGRSATFAVDGQAITLTQVGDHLEKVVGTASPVPYSLHPDARPVPCP